MKKIFSLVLTLCIIIGCLSVPMVASASSTAIYNTAKDTTSVALSAGLAYTITEHNTIGGIDEKEWGFLGDKLMNTQFYTKNHNEAIPSLTVDLGKECTITAIVLYGNNAATSPAINTTVSYSVDGKFYESATMSKTALTSSTAVQSDYYHTLTGYINRYEPTKTFTARYLKLNMVSSSAYNISEMAIYGAASDDYAVSDGIGYSIASYSSGTAGIDANDWNYLNDGIVTATSAFYSNTVTGEDTVPTMVVDLGKVYDVSNVVSYGGGSYSYCELKNFQYSLDNVNWTTANVTAKNKPTGLYRTDGGMANLYTLSGVKARYLRISIGITTAAKKMLNVQEICIFGSTVCDAYITDYTAEGTTVKGEVTFQNRTEAAENDKCYLMAVYVDDVLYDVVVGDNSTANVASGTIGTTRTLNCTLPEGTTGAVTAKMFVWSDLTTLVPVVEPITLK